MLFECFVVLLNDLHKQRRMKIKNTVCHRLLNHSAKHSARKWATNCRTSDNLRNWIPSIDYYRANLWPKFLCFVWNSLRTMILHHILIGGALFTVQDQWPCTHRRCTHRRFSLPFRHIDFWQRGQFLGCLSDPENVSYQAKIFPCILSKKGKHFSWSESQVFRFFFLERPDAHILQPAPQPTESRQFIHSLMITHIIVILSLRILQQ